MSDSAAHDVYVHREDGRTCILVDGSWFVPLDAGGEGFSCERRHGVSADSEPLHLPQGLCGNRKEHEPHEVTLGSLAPYWCTADQTARLPWAAERRRQDGKV